MGGWPWTDHGLAPTHSGLAQLACGGCITALGYLLLVYPGVSGAPQPHAVLLPLPVTIGWFYSVIVAWLATFLIFDNWLWNLLRSSSIRAGSRMRCCTRRTSSPASVTIR